ncbi:peptidoglycan bridge formation glycyltransferase FemA/FemB family protein [Candidatus Saccharibacteria bacterium]|nr:peptidoglycan bridge formation glycyltransferase FemA/FemB family protein [Candidatus Saccharibacteria bacterium]
MSSFQQSVHWQHFQESIGRTTISDSGDGWKYLAVVEKGRLGSRLYVPYGPIATSATALAHALASLTAAAKDMPVSFIRFEPDGPFSPSDIAALGARRVARVQPEFTSIVDVTPDEAAIIAAMSPSNRNLHRTYAKKGIQLHTTTDPASVSKLTTLLHEVASHTGMHAHSDSYLSSQATTFFTEHCGQLYYAQYQGSVIAAALAYDYDGVRTYAHAAADYEHRKLAAGTVLVSQMILDAKRAGMRAVDLYGIWPNAKPGTPHYGITKFKRSFGGNDVAHNGTWEVPTKPLSYAAYRAATLIAKKRV